MKTNEIMELLESEADGLDPFPLHDEHQDVLGLSKLDMMSGTSRAYLRGICEFAARIKLALGHGEDTHSVAVEMCVELAKKKGYEMTPNQARLLLW